MILPGDVISEYVQHGLISILPHFDSRQLRPFGLRVHLADHLLVALPGQRVDLSSERPPRPLYTEHDLSSEPLVLPPRGFALGSTIESFRLDPTLMCRLDGRSTIARLGLLIHCTAEIIDSNHGEHRSIVVELANVGPFEIVIPRTLGIGMVTFERVVGEASLALEQDQYKGQTRVAPPNLAFEIPRYSGASEDESTR